MDFYISHFFNCCYYSLYDKLKYTLIFWLVLTRDLLERTKASVTHSAVPHVLLCCFNYILMLSVIYSWKDLQQHGVHLLITCWIPNATNELLFSRKLLLAYLLQYLTLVYAVIYQKTCFFRFSLKKNSKEIFIRKAKLKWTRNTAFLM